MKRDRSDEEAEERGVLWNRPKTRASTYGMSLTVQYGSQSHTFQVDPWTTGAAVKARIYGVMQVPVSQQQVLINGQTFESHRLLSHYTDTQHTNATLVWTVGAGSSSAPDDAVTEAEGEGGDEGLGPTIASDEDPDPTIASDEDPDPTIASDEAIDPTIE